MDWKQLESYVAVVQFRSFTRAAEELYISQPTISSHIQQLEKEFNSRLIMRTTKSVEITPHGWEVFEFARDVLDQQKALQNRLKDELSQALRIGAFTVPVTYILPEVLEAFFHEYPHAKVSIDQCDSDSVMSKILYDHFDIGFVSKKPEEPRLQYTPFYKDRIVLITPNTSEYRRYQQKMDWEEMIRQHPVILRDVERGNKMAADGMWEVMGYTEDQLDVCAHIDNLESIKAMVEAGVGIAMISEKAVQNIRDEKKILIFELPVEENEKILYVVSKKEYTPRKYQSELMHFVEDFYKK